VRIAVTSTKKRGDLIMVRIAIAPTHRCDDDRKLRFEKGHGAPLRQSSCPQKALMPQALENLGN
jgi:hypothetical protein